MAQTGVPYYDLLRRLAAFQYQLGGPVRFRFQKEPYRTDEHGGQPVTILSPILEQSSGAKTLPLFVYVGPEPLEDWSQKGYILILNSRISRGEGEFLLTSKTILLSDVE